MEYETGNGLYPESEEDMYEMYGEDSFDAADADSPYPEPEKASSRPEPKKKKKKRKRKRRKKHYLLRFILFVILVTGTIIFMRSSFFTIELIKVENNRIITEDQIIEMSGMETGENIFHYSALKVKKEIEKNPYIDHVSVHRKLPSVFQIRVREKEAIASIEQKGDYIIIDADGVVIDKNKTNMYTTVLSGIKLESYKIGEPPKVDNQARLENALKLIRSVNDSGMYFKKLKIVSSLTVEGYLTDNLRCSGMPDDILENLEGIKVILYDLDQKGIERGTIMIGKDGLASFSPDGS